MAFVDDMVRLNTKLRAERDCYAAALDRIANYEREPGEDLVVGFSLMKAIAQQAREGTK